MVSRDYEEESGQLAEEYLIEAFLTALEGFRPMRATNISGHVECATWTPVWHFNR